MGSDKQFGKRLAGLLMDCKKSRVILDAQQLKRITEIVRNASRPPRDISQSMFAMGIQLKQS
jgi:ribosomal protein L19E